MKPALSIVIPTYRREQVLLDTIDALLRCDPPADEILIVDQTERHEDATLERLDEMVANHSIRLIRPGRPSIPEAMNRGLVESRSEIVLFLDDDIVPSPTLIGAHWQAYATREVFAVVGQVLQPGQEPASPVPMLDEQGLRRGLGFRFNQTDGCLVQNVMAGNLSVRRDRAIEIGGFDERFTGVAYRFETDFARRIIAAGGSIWFEPAASIRHLQVSSGGTRSHGGHLTSASPRHSSGDYYFALLWGSSMGFVFYAARRMVREVMTRFHLRHPWWIPVKLIGEVRGLVQALVMKRRGRRLLRKSDVL